MPIKGRPRTISTNRVQNKRTTGKSLCRPTANRTLKGNASTILVVASNRVSSRPFQRLVLTDRSPKPPPISHSQTGKAPTQKATNQGFKIGAKRCPKPKLPKNSRAIALNQRRDGRGKGNRAVS